MMDDFRSLSARGAVRSVQRDAVQGAAGRRLPVLPCAARDFARCQGRQDRLQGRVHHHPGLAGQPSRRSRSVRAGSRPAISPGIAIAKPASSRSIATTAAAPTISSSSMARKSPRRSARRSSRCAASSPANTPSTSRISWRRPASRSQANVKVQKLNPTAQVVFDDKIHARPHRRREDRGAVQARRRGQGDRMWTSGRNRCWRRSAAVGATAPISIPKTGVSKTL